MAITFEVAGLMLTAAAVARSMAVMATPKVSEPLPMTPLQVNVKICCAPPPMLTAAGVGGPQSADAVPVAARLILGATESAGLPLLSTVAVTVMGSPGRTLAPAGPAAASPVM